MECFSNDFKSKTFKNRKQFCELKRRHNTYIVNSKLDTSYKFYLEIFWCNFCYALLSVYLLTLLFISLIWEWKNTICLTSFDFFDVQSVKRFVRRLITKWYDHYSSPHLIYNVNWIASLECTVFHRSIDLPRAWRRALNIHWKEGKIYPSCKMAYVVILSASYFFIYFRE